jgi:putative transposase
VSVAFVDENRDQFGVEFICRQLQVAASRYDAAKHRETAPSARAVRDAVMMQMLLALWVANKKIYGAHKLWKAARRAGHDIGRDQVARLMRELQIEGVSRLRKKVFTTRSDRGRDPGTGPGEPAGQGGPARRAVGHRSDLRADAFWDGLRVLHR